MPSDPSHRSPVLSPSWVLAVIMAMALAMLVGSPPARAQDPAPDGEGGAPADADATIIAEIADIARRLGEPDSDAWYRIEQRILELRHRAELQEVLALALSSADPVASRRARQLLALLSRPVDPALDARIPELVPNLFSSDPHRRIIACEMLWRVRTDAAAHELLGRLTDPRETREVRAHAALALAVFPLTRKLIDGLLSATSVNDREIATAALHALAHIDARTEGLRGESAEAGAEALAPLDGFLHTDNTLALVTAEHATRVARSWLRAAQVWRRVEAWRVLARTPERLDSDEIIRSLERRIEVEPEVRAILYRILLLLDLPADAPTRLALLKRMAALLPRELVPISRNALRSFLHVAATGPLASRLLMDGDLDEAVLTRLPSRCWESAAWYEPVRFESLVQHRIPPIAWRARRSVIRIGRGPALMTRLGVGTEPLARPGGELREVFRHLSRRTGVDILAASGFPTIDSFTIPGSLLGGHAYDVLATVGELFHLRFRFEGERLVAWPASSSVVGDRWLPRQRVPAALLDRYNRRNRPFQGATDQPTVTLAQLMTDCAELLEAPVVCSRTVAQTIGLDARVAPLPAGRPVSSGLPPALDPLKLRAVFRGASLWIGTSAELTAWAMLERFVNQPAADGLARLAAEPLLDRRPVVAECLLAHSPDADPLRRAAWVDAGVAELVKARELPADSLARDIRTGLVIRALSRYLDDPRVEQELLAVLGTPASATRVATANALRRADPASLWQRMAPRLPELSLTARRELAEALARSATPDRVTELIDTLVNRADLTGDATHVLALRSLRLPLTRIVESLLPSVPLERMPPGPPVSYAIHDSSPAFFLYALELASGWRMTPGVVLTDWWTRVQPYAEARFAVDSAAYDFRFELPRTLRALAFPTAAQLPLALEPHWYPGPDPDAVMRGAAAWPREVLLEVTGGRRELALFEALLQRLATREWTTPQPLPDGRATGPASRDALAAFAWWLTAWPGVSRIIEHTARKPAFDEAVGVLPEERVPSADRVLWQRIRTWLFTLESRSTVVPSEALARLGVRLRLLANLPIGSHYEPFADRTDDQSWHTPNAPPDPEPPAGEADDESIDGAPDGTDRDDDGDISDR